MAQAVLKTALIGFALAAARAQGLSWAECGFVRATPGWAGKVWLGALCGALATLAILGLGGSGAPLMRQLGLPGIVLWVWLYSSVSEEIFVRGWFQGLLSRGTDAALGTTGVALASAAMFSFLHLSLVLAGADLVTVGAVLAGTFALGWVCARARQQHGGLWPAIAAHIAFNVGGLLAGGAFVVAREAISMAVPR